VEDLPGTPTFVTCVLVWSFFVAKSGWVWCERPPGDTVAIGLAVRSTKISLCARADDSRRGEAQGTSPVTMVLLPLDLAIRLVGEGVCHEEDSV
jgi:hypothetical protein